jgi:hypothetical protein
MEFCSRGHRLQPNNLYTIKAAITHFNLGLPRIPGPYFEFASGPKEAAPSSGKIPVGPSAAFGGNWET